MLEMEIISVEKLESVGRYRNETRFIVRNKKGEISLIIVTDRIMAQLIREWRKNK